MATVRTRKRGKTYSYIFEAGKTLEGKRKVVEKGGFPTKEEAYNAGVEAYTNFKHGDIGITSEKLTVSEYLNLWLEKHSANVSGSSIYQYTTNITTINKYIGHIVLQDLKPRNIASMVEKFYKEGRAYNTIINRLNTIKVALDYAVYPAELISFNPIINIKVPKNAPKAVIERSIITYEQLQELLEADITKNMQAPLMLAYHTGMRLRELYGLTWDNIDFANGTITVEKQLKDIVGKRHFDTPKTSSSKRIIYMDSQLKDFLHELKVYQEEIKNNDKQLWLYSYQDEDGNIFQTSEKIKKYKEVPFVCCGHSNGKLIRAHSFALFLQKHGFNSHSFRHTHATMLAESNASMKEIASRLGHKKITVTADLYTHETDVMRKNVGEIFEKFIRKNADKKANADN